jgi:thiol-disulfide isomerase/thioredoxin
MKRYLFTIPAFLFLLSAAAFAEEKKGENVLQSTAAETPKIASLDEAKTVEDAKAYFQETLSTSFDRKDLPKEPAAQSDWLDKLGDVHIAAGERIFALGKDDGEKEEGLRLKINGLKARQHVEETRGKTDNTNKSKDGETLEKFLKKLDESGKYPAIVNDEKYQSFLRKNNKELREEFTLEKFAQFVKDLKQWSKTKLGTVPVRSLLAAVSLAESPTAKKLDPHLGKKTIKELIEFVKSDESTLTEEQKKEVLLQLNGSDKRALGADLELYGKTLDGKDFDWKALRGKYVLVKFTATWCGPCKREIPGLISAYEKYKDKGLEIVSVYIWERGETEKIVENVKKFAEDEKVSWLIVSEALSEKAGLPPQGKAYAVSGVPTMLLIGKDGKVIAVNARGEVLKKKLAELFEN